MKKINKLAMAKSYKAMGKINLEISKEFFHLENEGAKLHEMDSKKRESDS